MLTLWPNFKVLGAALGAGSLILIGGYGGMTWERAQARTRTETATNALQHCQMREAHALQDLAAREAALRAWISQEASERARRDALYQAAQNQYQEEVRHDPMVCPMDRARIERLHALAGSARNRNLAGSKTTQPREH